MTSLSAPPSSNSNSCFDSDSDSEGMISRALESLSVPIICGNGEPDPAVRVVNRASVRSLPAGGRFEVRDRWERALEAPAAPAWIVGDAEPRRVAISHRLRHALKALRDITGAHHGGRPHFGRSAPGGAEVLLRVRPPAFP